MRRTLRIGLVALALQPAVAWEVSAKPVRWSGNGHLYEVRVAPEPEGISWVQALLRADALGCGWYLVTITSKAENDFVFKLAARYPQIFDAAGGHGPFIGGFQANPFDEPAGNWRWVTDEPFRFKNWNPGEPNDHNGGESFINTYEKGTWNDTTVSDLLKGFIVEFDKQRQAACRKRG